MALLSQLFRWPSDQTCSKHAPIRRQIPTVHLSVFNLGFNYPVLKLYFLVRVFLTYIDE